MFKCLGKQQPDIPLCIKFSVSFPHSVIRNKNKYVPYQCDMRVLQVPVN